MVISYFTGNTMLAQYKIDTYDCNGVRKWHTENQLNCFLQTEQRIVLLNVKERLVQHIRDYASAKDDGEKLYMRAGNARAEGMVTTEGFVLLAGAVVNEKVSEKSLSKGAIALRKKIFDSGKVEQLTTIEDILFSSSSAAVDFVTGYSVSGPMTWKNAAERHEKK